jgi:hypothetical protein
MAFVATRRRRRQLAVLVAATFAFVPALVSRATASTVPTVTMSFVGDTDLGNTPILPADPVGYLAPVKSAISAPIAFGNLEGTLTASGAESKCPVRSSSCYAFRNPPSFAAIYRQVGFNVLNSANNHSHDYGTQGVVSTTLSLRGAGVVQAGLPGQIGLVRVGSVRVAFVDFAPYSSTNDLRRITTAISLIREARSLLKASVVVVYMHAGAEGAGAIHVTGQSEYYLGENRGNPKLFAETMIDHGASLVVASGPHVLRGMEFYHGHLIDYSLGDFTNYRNFSTSGRLALSGVLRVTLSATGSFESARFLSVRLNQDGRGTLDPSVAAARLVASLSREDFGSRAPGIANNGHVVPPPGAFTG